MNRLLQDLRFAIRTMVKKPGFTLTAVVTLAIGIGASTAIFTVVDAALLRGLPYKSPDQLYHLWEKTPQQQFSQREFSYPDYQDYQQNTSLELAAYTGGGGIMSGRGEPERVFVPQVSANFFSLLGVQPVIGRTFQEGEDKPGAPGVTVLTYGMWQSKFGGDTGIVGQTLRINGQNYTVIGVLPASFQFALRNADLWIAYQPNEAQLTRRSLHGTNLIARLKPGKTSEQVNSELSVIARRIEQEHNESHAGTSMKIVPLQEEIVGDVKPILYVLLGAVGFVLLIACANVAGLMLTRSLSRSKEVAIRSALGASRWRVVRQLLTESVLLAVVGGLAGLLIAYWGLGALVAILPDRQLSALPFLKSLNIDTRILGFSFALSLLTGILFGLVPALQSSRLDLNEALKEGGRTTAAAVRHRLRSVFVVSQIALAVVLLVGAGLMMKSLLRLLQANIGFNPDNVLTMSIVLPPKYADAPAIVNFHQQLRERLQALPGVTSVGSIDNLPLQGGNTTRFYVDGDPVPAPGQATEANFRVADENYFQTLGIPIVAGRAFDGRDQTGSQSVVIIGKNVADKLFAGRDPVGRRIKYPSFADRDSVVVGVAGDVRTTGIDEPLKAVLYFPFRQFSSSFTNVVVRTTTDPATMASSVRNEIRSLEPAMAIFNVRTMEELMSTSPAAFMRRFPGVLITIFAGVALLLASIGIYGVISYSVSQQSHPIGVRMALGAQRFDILKLVLKEGLVMALVGIVLGVLAAIGLTQLLTSFLFEVQPTDPSTIALVVIALVGVALLASYIPARRATKVDPLEALRYE